MKKFSLTTLCISLISLSSVYAQIKSQYESNQTTVVIKEDEANDMDILNQQFDLDEIGMHQVIRITTGSTPPNNEAVDISQVVTIQEEQIQEAEVFSASTDETILPSLTTLQTSPPPLIKVEKTKPEKQNKPTVKTTSTEKNTKKKSSHRSKKYSSKRHKKKKFKAFNKRFRKQKRKRVPRKRKRNKKCYRF